MPIPRISALKLTDFLESTLPDKVLEIWDLDDGSILFECTGLLFYWDIRTEITYYCDTQDGRMVVTGVVMSLKHVEEIIKESMDSWVSKR